MLQLLDESIESFLRATVPLDPNEVAVAFEAPDRQWAAGVSQPTVNVFLWDVQRDTDAARAGMETVHREGKELRRRPLPRMQIRYIVSAWTSSHRDEHQLLGQLMLAVLRTPTLEPPHLQGGLDKVQPYPSMKLAPTGGRSSGDFWKAVDGQLKPALELLIVLPVDPGFGSEVAERPTEVEVSTSDSNIPTRTSRRGRIGGIVDDPAAVGRVVRTRRGVGRVEEGGRYLVPGEPGDEVVLELGDEHVVIKDEGERS
jgi:hypothetical protein